MDLSKLSLGGITLVFLIIGLVQFAKEQGWVSGAKKLKLLAAGLGIFFAALYQLGVMFPGAVQYVSVFVFVVAAGLAATGLFDFTKEVISKPPTG